MPRAVHPREKRKAAELLAIGIRPSQAAAAIDVSRQTVRNWTQQPDFQAKVEEYREKLMATLVDDGPTIFKDAMNALREMVNQTEDADNRTRASIHITKHLVPSADAILAAQAKRRDRLDDPSILLGKITDVLRDHPEAAQAVAAALLEGQEDDAA